MNSSTGPDFEDIRYNVPKMAPVMSEELVTNTIVNNEIYRRARLAIITSPACDSVSKTTMINTQRKQVAYGLDKYPESLNADTWGISETIDHIMDESIDKLHYLIMLQLKLEKRLVALGGGSSTEITELSNRISDVTDIIRNTVTVMDAINSIPFY